MDGLRDSFALDPEITYLNHGSFGACPRAVLDAYWSYQIQMERQPARFLGRQIGELMQSARHTLGAYLGVSGNDLVYFTNPTSALNMVARNLKFDPGDEILATNHEYGALNRTWQYFARQVNASYVTRSFSLPVGDPQEMIEEFWSGVTSQTRVIFISHITSPTALILPVEEICQRAAASGILTIVDGAHAPGQIPLDLSKIGADIYTGALHKWLCAPKGAAFIYIARKFQHLFDPLVISWGYDSENPSESRFVDYHEWQGTRDMSAFLSVPHAIAFQEQHDWPDRREYAHQLAADALQRLTQSEGFEALSKPGDPIRTYRWYAQMVTIQIPDCDVEALKNQLYDHYRIEVPVYRWQGIPLIRISIQAYNTAQDVDRLIDAIEDLMDQGFFQ